LTDICRSAVEGYLQTNVSEGLKAPVKLVRSKNGSKPIAVLHQYGSAWELLKERERLCFDLVMFAGMRESEVFGLWCGDITDDGVRIERSWYKGKYEAPKTPKSEREVGIPDEILNRLKDWVGKLPVNSPTDCVFPSSTLVTPDLAGERT
jgi:integrase